MKPRGLQASNVQYLHNRIHNDQETVVKKKNYNYNSNKQKKSDQTIITIKCRACGQKFFSLLWTIVFSPFDRTFDTSFF